MSFRAQPRNPAYMRINHTSRYQGENLRALRRLKSHPDSDIILAYKNKFIELMIRSKE
jgi:hypothetical protein